MDATRRPTATYRWWLRLQVGLLLGGGATWVVGAVLEEAFVTGAGAGMLVGALALRLGRRAAKDSPHRETGETPSPGESGPTDIPPAEEVPPASDVPRANDGRLAGGTGRARDGEGTA